MMFKHRLKTFTALYRTQYVAFDEWQPGDVTMLIMYRPRNTQKSTHTCIYHTLHHTKHWERSCMFRWEDPQVTGQIPLYLSIVTMHCIFWMRTKWSICKQMITESLLAWHSLSSTNSLLQKVTQADSHELRYIPFAQTASTQLDCAVREDMFPFYMLLEKAMFMSLGGGSGHKMGRTKCALSLCSTLKWKNIQHNQRDVGIFEQRPWMSYELNNLSQ